MMLVTVEAANNSSNTNNNSNSCYTWPLAKVLIFPHARMWECAVQPGTDLSERHKQLRPESGTNAWARAGVWVRSWAHMSSHSLTVSAKSITNKTASTHRLIGFKIKMQTHSSLLRLLIHLPSECRAYFCHSHFFYISGLLLILFFYFFFRFLHVTSIFLLLLVFCVCIFPSASHFFCFSVYGK